MTRIAKLVISQSLMVIAAALITSCSATNPCPKTPNPGNIGSLFNTDYDEYSPVFIDDTLYFTTAPQDPKKPERIYRSVLSGGNFSLPALASDLPLSEIRNSGLPSFRKIRETGAIEMFFAGVPVNSKKNDRGIFTAVKTDGKWSRPVLLPKEVNTEYYESHPFVSPDGKYLFFTSDRPGGVGNIDLYVSKRENDGTWTPAVNLGKEINTAKNEITPFVDSLNNLYFASKGRKDGIGGYDIYKAAMTGDMAWGNVKILPLPINTEADESGPALKSGKIYLSSDRKNGCGGKDLYAFDLCGPVIVEGKVSSEAMLPLSGICKVMNTGGGELMEVEVPENGEFSFAPPPDMEYIVRYFNKCVPGYVPEQKIFAPCSESNSIRIVMNFVMPSKLKEYAFNEQNIPFFVSGYYYPNVPKNLEALRLKFSYNLVGADSSTRYIEHPGEKYDEYATKVDKALKEAAGYIRNILANVKSDCGALVGAKLLVRVTGYSDPRPISASARYNDDDVNDDVFGIRVKRGEVMTNDLLSLLRAYHTAKYLESLLSTDAGKENGHIRWEIIGKGVDESEGVENELKRHVQIEIGIDIQ